MRLRQASLRHKPSNSKLWLPKLKNAQLLFVLYIYQRGCDFTKQSSPVPGGTFCEIFCGTEWVCSCFCLLLCVSVSAQVTDEPFEPAAQQRECLEVSPSWWYYDIWPLRTSCVSFKGLQWGFSAAAEVPVRWWVGEAWEVWTAQWMLPWWHHPAGHVAGETAGGLARECGILYLGWPDVAAKLQGQDTRILGKGEAGAACREELFLMECLGAGRTCWVWGGCCH